MSVVTVGEVKLHARITSGMADTLLKIYIDAAEAWLASHLGVAWEQATHTERIDGGADLLCPDVKPVTSITSITDKWDDTVVDPSTYRLTPRGAVRELGEFPFWDAGDGRYEMVYVGGYASMPAPAKYVIIALVTKAWNNRDNRMSESSLGGLTTNWQQFLSGDMAMLLHGIGYRAFA